MLTEMDSGAKPSARTRRTCRPTGTPLRVYAPRAVGAVRGAVFATVTVVPTTPAPVLSVILPCSDPVCAVRRCENPVTNTSVAAIVPTRRHDIRCICSPVGEVRSGECARPTAVVSPNMLPGYATHQSEFELEFGRWRYQRAQEARSAAPAP